MLIAIPTYGRVNNQKTWNNFSPELQEQTVLIVQQREFAKYAIQYSHAKLHCLPDHIRDIASTRQFITDLPYDRIIMVDDDLDFAVRRNDDPTKFRPATHEEIRDTFYFIHRTLAKPHGVAHMGISCREGANRNTNTYVYNNRILRVHGFNLEIFRRENIRFTPHMFMTDFDVTLQLLERGYKNIIVNWMVQNQAGSNTPGGCSEARSLEKLAESAKWLQSRHPEFVTLVTKQTKSSWGGGERTDVRIQWKAAYNSSRTSRITEVLDGGAQSDKSEEGNGGAEAME